MHTYEVQKSLHTIFDVPSNCLCMHNFTASWNKLNSLEQAKKEFMPPMRVSAWELKVSYCLQRFINQSQPQKRRAGVRMHPKNISPWLTVHHVSIIRY